jgi:ketosteroid isomerase-like protein
MNRLLIIAAIALFASAASAQTPSDSAAAVATAERFHAALAAGDSATALSLLTSDVTILESGGMENVTQYRSHHLPADIAFAQAVKSARKLEHVHIRGDVAWIVASTTSEGTFRDRPVNSVGVELMVLTRQQGSWRISAIHWSSRRLQRNPS